MQISSVNQVRALRKKLVVFSVPVRRKLKSGIILANIRREALFRAEDVWIVSVGANVRESVKAGQKGIISDGMELESTDLNLWDSLKDLEEFKSLRDYVEEVDGEVRTQIITEDSLLAVYE